MSQLSLRLLVEADFDPLLPARLLARLTVRNTLPPACAFRVGDADSLFADIVLPAMDLEAAERLAHQFRAIATVRAVTLVRRVSTLGSPK
jgi:hypothetical protein